MAFVAVALLASCGSDDDPNASASSASTSSSDSPTGSEDAEIPEGRGVVTTNDDGTRTVGSAYGTAQSGFVPHLEGRTDGIEPLAWTDGAPAEAIAERRPDLIFAPDADIVFWQVRQRDADGSRDTTGLDLAKRSPLRSQIPAVAAGSLFEVDNRPWYLPAILAAHRILDDVETALVE